MAMLFVQDVATYFRTIVDEPDVTFLDDAMVQQFLEIGFDQYQQFINQIQPNYNSVTTDLVWSDQDFFALDDFAGGFAILGSQVTQARLMQAISLSEVDANGQVIRVVNPSNSFDELQNSYLSDKWALGETGIRFSRRTSGTFRLAYQPESAVDWSALLVGDEFIDNFTMYHDVIALLAGQNYGVIDAAENPQMFRLMQVRLAAFKQYLRNRNANARRVAKKRWY